MSIVFLRPIRPKIVPAMPNAKNRALIPEMSISTVAAIALKPGTETDAAATVINAM